MHDGSQIQDNGRSDVTSQADSGEGSLNRDQRPEISWWCNRCNSQVGPRKKNPNKTISHDEHIKKCWPHGTHGVDYVECALCKFAACNITQHVKNKHGFSKYDYVTKYGSTLASDTKKKYGSVAKSRESWITREKRAGNDLHEYRDKMSKAVSKAILQNDKERKRRSELLGSLNKRADFRDRSSAAAKITSKRPDIVEARTERLRRWRNDNPDKFRATINKAMETHSSKPERRLYEICKEILGESLRRQIQIKHGGFPTQSKRVYVDMGSRTHKVLIEFDGPFHFKPILGEEVLERRKTRDAALEEYVIKHAYLLVRVSYDVYSAKGFSDEAKEKITTAILSDVRSAVIYVGEAYKKGL